jgi:hypothetical protein
MQYDYVISQFFCCNLSFQLGWKKENWVGSKAKAWNESKQVMELVGPVHQQGMDQALPCKNSIPLGDNWLYQGPIHSITSVPHRWFTSL